MKTTLYYRNAAENADATDGKPFGGDPVKLADVFPHPDKRIISRAEMQHIIAAGNHLCQRKYDGCLSRREVAGSVLLGEIVTTRSGAFLTAADRALIARHGVFFAAFTVAEVDGKNVLNQSTATRWGMLNGLAGGFAPDMVLAETVTDVAGVFEASGEGVCAHDLGGIWGEMLCVKVAEIFTCRITATGGTQSVQIADAVTGEMRGNVKLGGGAVDQVRIGSTIRIEGMGLTDAGKIRQPVKCREWLVNY